MDVWRLEWEYLKWTVTKDNWAWPVFEKHQLIQMEHCNRIQVLHQSRVCTWWLFKRKSTSYSLRNSDFDIPTFNTINYGKHSLRYQGPHIWSKLDIKLKGSSNIESFKKNIRKKDLTSLLNNNYSCCNLCNS